MRETCGLSSRKMTSIVMCVDNVACIAQLKKTYIIIDKLFSGYVLQKNSNVFFKDVNC